jgi:hypothetical protein
MELHGTSIAVFRRLTRQRRESVSLSMEPAGIPVEPSVDGRNDAARAVNQAAPAPRAWPRCEPGFMHFELGASSDDVSTAVMRTRHTPSNGIRKD